MSCSEFQLLHKLCQCFAAEPFLSMYSMLTRSTVCRACQFLRHACCGIPCLPVQELFMKSWCGCHDPSTKSLDLQAKIRAHIIIAHESSLEAQPQVSDFTHGVQRPRELGSRGGVATLPQSAA